MPRIIAIAILNGFGIKAFNSLPVIRFALSDSARAILTPEYSYALETNFRPNRDYLADLRNMHQPQRRRGRSGACLKCVRMQCSPVRADVAQPVEIRGYELCARLSAAYFRVSLGRAFPCEIHMAAEFKKEIELEIAHVLFLDIVGYSKLSVNEQHAQVEQLNEIVRLSEQFRKAEAAGRLLKIPTGDGMALVFYKSPEEPAQCAVEISRALKDNGRLQVRMGIHNGPVSGVVDVTERTNVAGAGVNMAQRVMDCGDAGHILLSRHVAEDLAEYQRWRPFLHDIGTFEVKHGVRVSVTNLYSDEVGNPQLPSKLQAVRKHRAHVRWAEVAIALLVLGAIVSGAFFFLRRPIRSAAAIAEKSIAVLPFENLSDDKSNAYFAEGIQDEILTKLARIADLKVISRTSAAKYKTKPDDLKTVSQQLGAANILEGSVQKAAGKVRVNVQLIDARADAHLWAETYDRDIKDIFAVESEISQEIANALQAKLTPAETDGLTTAPTQDPEAYDLFLKGEYAEREEENLLKAEPFDRAAAFYQQALARDSNFALAAARLAENRVRRHWFIAKLSDVELADAKTLADRALALSPGLAEAHIALATFYYFGARRYNEALQELQSVLELQPNNVRALELSAYIHRRQGGWERAVTEMAKCEERDPRNVSLVANLGAAYCSLRMWQEAKRVASRSLAIDPHSFLGLQTVIFALLNGSGDIEEARRTLEKYPPGGRISDFSVIASIPPGVYLKVIDRDFSGALKVCEAEIVDPSENRSRLAMRAAIRVLTGEAARAQTEIAQTRELLEARLRERPDDVYALLQLSWVDVALQRNSEALSVAHKATEMVPIEKDALLGPTYLAALAQIQARTGESGEAVKTLRRLLSMPIGFYVSIQQLKIDPVWDPIRQDPGFQQLLVGKEQIGPNKQ